MAQRLARLIKEHSVGPGNGSEMPLAIVKIKYIRFPFFDDRYIGLVLGKPYAESLLGSYDGLTIDYTHFRPAIRWVILVISGPVVRHIQIEIAVTVNIRQRHRGRTVFAQQPGIARFSEVPLAIIEEQAGSTADGIHQEIEFSIAVDISEDSTGRMLPRASNACRLGDVEEFPIPEVLIKHIRTVDGAKVDVAQTIAIDITQRHARAVLEDAVFACPGVRETIGESDSRDGWWQQLKTRSARRGNRKGRTAVAGAFD